MSPPDLPHELFETGIAGFSDAAISSAGVHVMSSVPFGTRLEGVTGKAWCGTRAGKRKAENHGLLIECARQILIVPSLHAGTIWEIEQILEADALDRTLWLMPSVRGGRASRSSGRGCEPRCARSA